MITITLRKKIKRVLGAQYSQPIIEYLNSKLCFNSDGNPYSKESIQALVRAANSRENLVVEGHILDLLAIKQRNGKKLKEKQSKVIKTK